MTGNNTAKHSQLVVPTILHGAKASYASSTATMLALDPKALLRVYIDVKKAATAALATVERVQPFAEQIRRLYQSDLDEVAQLATFARAAWHADVVATATEPDNLKPVAEEGYAVRNQMLASARDLAQRGLLPADRVKAVSMTRRYATLAASLHSLSTLFDAAWADIEDKTPVTQAEIAHARSLSERIGSQLIARTVSAQPDEPDAMGMRQRAFTLLIEQYNRVRRAMAFIIADDVAVKAIAPPLAQAYVYCGGRRSKTPPRERAAAVVDAPSAAVTSPPPSGTAPSATDAPAGLAPPRDSRRSVPVKLVDLSTGTSLICPSD